MNDLINLLRETIPHLQSLSDDPNDTQGELIARIEAAIKEREEL